MRKEIIRVNHLVKNYGENCILNDFNMNLYEGEVMGIIGLHDSGKSVLLRILSGKENYSKGSIFYNEDNFSSKVLLLKNKVFLIQKESSLVGRLSIVDNIFIIRKHIRPKVFINKWLMDRQLQAYLAELELEFSPNTKVYDLMEGEQYIIEIVKAYILGAKVILIDDIFMEPSNDNYYLLSKIIEKLKIKGISFVITGYKMENLQMFSERILFLSRGNAVKIVENIRRNQIDVKKILIDQGLQQGIVKEKKQISDDILFEVNNLSNSCFHNVSFQIKKGEIVLIVDILKTTNLALYQFLQNPEQEHVGKVYIEQKVYDKRRYGNQKPELIFADFLTQDKIVECLSLKDNLCLSQSKKFSSFGFIHRKRMQYVEDDFLAWYGEKDWPNRKNCKMLSEKEKMGMYLYELKLQKGKVLLCNNPEGIVDYLSYQMIERQLQHLAEQGMGIGIFASNISRIHQLADSFVIISDGSMQGKYDINKLKSYFNINDNTK